jgi:hypothetical protein
MPATPPPVPLLWPAVGRHSGHAEAVAVVMKYCAMKCGGVIDQVARDQ